MKASEALQQALDLFGPNGEHWTQKQFACNSVGNAVGTLSAEATSWCAVGACERVANYGIRYATCHFLRKAVSEDCISIVEHNDSAKDFNEIRAWFTVAIALAKAAEQ